MRIIDFVKAGVVALAIMAVNVAISFGVVAAYATVVDPGHDAATYQSAAQWIAPWSSVVFGWVLFFAVCMVLARRRPERSALSFALAAVAIYCAIDLGVIAAAGSLEKVGPIVAVSLSSKLVGAIGGVWVAGR